MDDITGVKVGSDVRTARLGEPVAVAVAFCLSVGPAARYYLSMGIVESETSTRERETR